MLREFKEFAMKGSVLDLAVGVVIGAAFGKIVGSFTSDVLMPPLGLILGRVDLPNLFVSLNGAHYATLADAQKAGAPTLNYGLFLTAIVDFVIVAFALFLLVRQVNRFRREPEKAPMTRACPFCQEPISLRATRCAHCTSEIAAAAARA